MLIIEFILSVLCVTPIANCNNESRDIKEFTEFIYNDNAILITPSFALPDFTEQCKPSSMEYLTKIPTWSEGKV